MTRYSSSSAQNKPLSPKLYWYRGIFYDSVSYTAEFCIPSHWTAQSAHCAVVRLGLSRCSICTGLFTNYICHNFAKNPPPHPPSLKEVRMVRNTCSYFASRVFFLLLGVAFLWRFLQHRRLARQVGAGASQVGSRGSDTTLQNSHCTLHAAHCTLGSVHCTLRKTQWKLNTAQCALHSVHCKLCTALETLQTAYETLRTPDNVYYIYKLQ